MDMSIVLPIALNAIILIIGIFGALIGKKNGAIYELLKLVVICGACVGIYFLTPVIYSLLLKINYVEQLVIHGFITEALIYSVLTTLLFVISYIIISVVFGLICHKITNKEENGAKRVKIKGINRKETRELRKQQKKLDKIHRQNKESIETKKLASKVFGIIFGCILSLIVSFGILLPVKETIKVVTDNEKIIEAYAYTPYGQLDNITNIIDFIDHVGE